MTPVTAIRLAIKDLRNEINMLHRKNDTSKEMQELIAELESRITALNEAHKIINAAQAMKTALADFMAL